MKRKKNDTATKNVKETEDKKNMKEDETRTGKKNKIKREVEINEEETKIGKKNKIKREDETKENVFEKNSTYLYHYSFIEKEQKDLKQNLLDWYYKYKRRLPWRDDQPPYCTSIQIKDANKDKGILDYFMKKEKQMKEGTTLKAKKENQEIDTDVKNDSKDATKKEIKTEVKVETDKNIETEMPKETKTDTEGNIENTSNEMSDNDLSLKGYRIYISEIMLQQTRVPTVLNYYLTWMEKWKSIFDLAKSDLNDVLKIWKGLGYYNRAKNLLECCKIVVKKYNGIFPNDLKLLKELPGIGNYTAKAICIHLYNMKDICVDTNIIRIFSRTTDAINYYNSTILNKHCDYVSSILCKDEEKCSDLSQALMDLGSSLCNNAPQCSICPINKNCLMHLRKKQQSQSTYLKHPEDCELCIRDGERDAFEIKNVPLVKIKKKTDKICLVLLVKKLDAAKYDESYLMKKNTDTNLFSMHYLFPFLLLNQLIKEEEVNKHLMHLLTNLNLKPSFNQKESFIFINSFTHKFSHLTYNTRIYLCSITESNALVEGNDYVWVKLKDVKNFAHNTFCQNIIDLYKRHTEKKINIFTMCT